MPKTNAAPALSTIIERLDLLREELMAIQRSLEKMEAGSPPRISKRRKVPSG
jgi:hypothetical protein